jgi:phosphopentomutase
VSRRVIVIVLDGCGAGAAPDAADYGDAHGPSTLKNVWNACDGLRTPILTKLGWWSAAAVGESDAACFGRLKPMGCGKDSVTGHWEMMGARVTTPFPTYPDGFPIGLVKEFEKRIGTQTLANCAASGTQIIDTLGECHMDTGFPILYTSADSVFQLAVHEDVVPTERLYEWCRIARELCVEPDQVQRIIARPFVGAPGAFKRTERRKDFPVIPPHCLVDELAPIHGIGVIPELFGGRGFLDLPRTQSNKEHEKALLAALETDHPFIFANFEDFDMLYGHRSDPKGFGRCLEEFDAFLADLLPRLKEEDLLILTADHGNDPTDESTDHTREYVPFVKFGDQIEPSQLGDQDGFEAVGQEVMKWLSS